MTDWRTSKGKTKSRAQKRVKAQRSYPDLFLFKNCARVSRVPCSVRRQRSRTPLDLPADTQTPVPQRQQNKHRLGSSASQSMIFVLKDYYFRPKRYATCLLRYWWSVPDRDSESLTLLACVDDAQRVATGRHGAPAGHSRHRPVV